MHRSFRAAAAAVGLSPAAFSERIQRLEEDLGAKLLSRGGRQVRLTPAGERLLPHARQLLTDARRCREVVGAGARQPYELNIGTRFELGLSWLVPAIEHLRKEVPERRLHLVFGVSRGLTAGLLQGEIDALVSSMRLTQASLQYELLHEERYALVAAPELLAGVPLDQPEHAARHVLVDSTGDLPLFRYWRDAQSPDEHWAFAHVERMGTIGAIKARILAGAGVGVLPEYFTRPELEAGTLVEVGVGQRPRADWFRLIWREGHPRDAELRALGEALRARPLR